MQGLGFRIFLTLLAAILASVGVPAAAPAQTRVAKHALPVCILAAPTGMTVAALFTDKARFDCKTRQTAFGAGDYWARSAPLDRDGPVNVRTASVWQDRMVLYALYGDGAIVAAATDQRSASRYIQLGAIIERTLPARSTPLVRLLWHIEGSANLRGILLGAEVATAAESVRSNLIMAMIYAAFVGLCVALIIYNLALWGVLRHHFQLAYCVMVAGLLVHTISASGALAWAWPEIANNDRTRINYLALSVAAAAAMLFARHFFEPRVFKGWLARTSTVVSSLMLGSAILFALLAPWQITILDRLYSLAFVAQLAIVLPTLWRGWRLRSNYLWMFTIAWAAPILLACVRIANSLHFIGWSFWLDNSTILTMAVEALLSSLAIAYRIRLLAHERDVAREQEIAARILADTDPLTALLNRRALLRAALGQRTRQTLLLIDLDHFKRVNETIGHDGGDEVLRIVARTLRGAAHAQSLVARIGGEEFAIVTPVEHPVDPETLLRRLRISRMPFDIVVTASIGTCTGPLMTETDWKMLYCCADRALFEAKASGRDRVRHAGESTPTIAVAA